MVQPTEKELSLIKPIERLGYRLANWVNLNVKRPFITWNALFMYALIWFALSRRLKVEGTSELSDLGPDSSVLIAANHRTFFDFFVVTWVNYDRSSLPRRIFFPVRSGFFYDNPIGMFLNLMMGGFAMFPPMFRRPESKAFNRFSLKRIIAELNHGGCVIGIHPEGTRNKNPDPCTLLPAKRGVANILVGCSDVYFVPVFIRGLSNSFAHEIWLNWTAAEQNPIVVRYGAPERFLDGQLVGSVEEEGMSEEQLLDWVMGRIKSLF